MVSSSETWVLQLDPLNQQDYVSLTMPNRLQPKSWTVQDKYGITLKMADRTEATLFFSDTLREYTDREIWVSIQQDYAGRHKFVSLYAACLICMDEYHKSTLDVREEEIVKGSANSVLLYARPEAENQRAQIPAYKSPGGLDLSAYRWSNYSVIPQLSLGNNLMILCDENTLCSVLPDEHAFDNLVLIVNCHENKCDLNKYRVGTCSTPRRPQVLCHAVHTWSRASDNIEAKCDEMQVAIWQGLQKGSVAVHCLAGIHRAACIVACQYLYRHYTLGHGQITDNHDEIYRQMKAVRPAVSPAYTHVLMQYQAHLKR